MKSSHYLFIGNAICFTALFWIYPRLQEIPFIIHLNIGLIVIIYSFYRLKKE